MSLAPARGKLREGTSGVDRSQAASVPWGERPREGDWSDLWLDVIMRRLATSDRRVVTAAEWVYSTWQFNPIAGGEARGQALCGSRLAPQPITVCVRLENGRAYLREWKLAALRKFVKKLRPKDEWRWRSRATRGFSTTRFRRTWHGSWWWIRTSFARSRSR